MKLGKIPECSVQIGANSNEEEIKKQARVRKRSHLGTWETAPP